MRKTGKLRWKRVRSSNGGGAGSGGEVRAGASPLERPRMISPGRSLGAAPRAAGTTARTIQNTGGGSGRHLGRPRRDGARLTRQHPDSSDFPRGRRARRAHQRAAEPIHHPPTPPRRYVGAAFGASFAKRGFVCACHTAPAAPSSIFPGARSNRPSIRPPTDGTPTSQPTPRNTKMPRPDTFASDRRSDGPSKYSTETSAFGRAGAGQAVVGAVDVEPRTRFDRAPHHHHSQVQVTSPASLHPRPHHAASQSERRAEAAE